MLFIRLLQSPGGRALRVLVGLLLLAYGGLTPTFPGVVAMMAGVMSLVTGVAGLPHPPSPSNHRV